MLDCLNCLRLKECYILGAMEQFGLSNGIEAIVISCKSFLEPKGKFKSFRCSKCKEIVGYMPEGVYTTFQMNEFFKDYLCTRCKREEEK